MVTGLRSFRKRKLTLTAMQREWRACGPRLWLSHVDKQVKVKTRRQEHRGRLLSVDPVSASLVLVNLVEGGAAVCVVMGHAVEEVELLQEAGGEMTAQLWALFEPSPSSSLDSTQTRRRRAAVCSWLRKNRVPVEEAGEEVRVAGALTIVAPYRPEDCSSSNQVILDRVQRLLRTQQERTEASD
ncbi:gem-associated protein 6 [Oryzias melastigma]|uniref:Gem nuclear organelle associated protein 6 n=1 Tax=Oryzias melastigma TaxID=30732 RepID=A0A3B3D9G8_ORYME|nr:gem-associated protein 6 [Oryzias melastigma]